MMSRKMCKNYKRTIASPAIHGGIAVCHQGKNTPAAMGIPSALYRNAKKRLSRILLKVSLEI